MAGEVRDSDSDSLLANLLSLLSCNACWRSHYEAPPEQSTEPPVQSLAQSLIPSSFGPVSAQPSVEEEGYASLLPAGKPGSGPNAADLDTTPSSSSAGRARLKAGASGHKKHKSDQGIELKEAPSNPLLGQYHLHGDHNFVRAKVHAKSGGQHDSNPPYAGVNGHAASQIH